MVASTRKMIKKRRTPRRRRVVYIKPKVPLNGVQNSEIVKLRYVEQLHIPGGSGTHNHRFRCNSLYDPNYSSTGHQPMGFDELAARYNHYMVLGARIKITSVAAGTASTDGDAPSWVMVSTTANPTQVYANFTSVLESKPFGQQKKMYVSNYAPWNQSPDKNDQKVLSAYYDPKKMFGLTKATLRANEDLKALVNTNPQEDAIWQIQAFPVATNGTRDGIHLLIEIDYTAVFTEPKQIPSS